LKSTESENLHLEELLASHISKFETLQRDHETEKKILQDTIKRECEERVLLMAKIEELELISDYSMEDQNSSLDYAIDVGPKNPQPVYSAENINENTPSFHDNNQRSKFEVQLSLANSKKKRRIRSLAKNFFAKK
jgi:hypothetical protein